MKITQCGLDEGIEAELLQTQRECIHVDKQKARLWGNHVVPPKGWKIWLTCAEREPECLPSGVFRASVCVNSTGTVLGLGKTVTYKGDCIIHTGRDVKDGSILIC